VTLSVYHICNTFRQTIVKGVKSNTVLKIKDKFYMTCYTL